MEAVYEVWVEIQANKELITNAERFAFVMHKCKEAGMTGVILSVKDTSGFVLYKSELAEHYSVYDNTFLKDVDYVETCFAIIREEGLRCYAAFDVFTEGNKDQRHPAMKGYRPGWACEVYGLDEDGNSVIQKSTDDRKLHTVGSIDDFGEIFVNPGNKEVQDYELSLLREFSARYHPDGIVLDRVRYVGLSADFSNLSRVQWEQLTGITDENWPEDLYTIEKKNDRYHEVPGKYFGSFYIYRAGIIRDFMKRARDTVKEISSDIEFCDYTGSWYPLYYQVGANWASANYEPYEFEWCDKHSLQETGYAELTDRLLSGFYYPDITIEDAEKYGKPAYWYSVEGSYKIANLVTSGKKGLVGSLFIEQYREFPERILRAMQVCFSNTSGCMLFDLSYIEKYNWWNLMKRTTVQKLEAADLDAAYELCKEAFPACYHVTKEKLCSNLFHDEQFSEAESRKIINDTDGSMIGFIGVKISDNPKLYKDTAWISIMAVKEDERRNGYGSLLLFDVCQNLKKSGIQKIYLGQDFANFFSGIPDPGEEKERFFQEAGFTLNFEKHFDLEADIVQNTSIDTYDDRVFTDRFCTDVFRGDTNALLSFLEREFPGRWVFEAQQSIADGRDPESILLLYNKEKTELLGYCMLSADGNGYGGLGPIGIAAKIRGNHVGDFLLNRSLRQLRKIGAKTVNIDWTILKDFYGQFGFTVARTYLAAYLDFGKKRG